MRRDQDELPPVIINGQYIKGMRYYLTIDSNRKINVNTASKAVLMTLSPDITDEIAESIIEARGGNGAEPATMFKDSNYYSDSPKGALLVPLGHIVQSTH